MNLEDWYNETERPEERELKRKLRRQAIRELIGEILLVVLGIVILLFFVYATPPSWSAINDLDEEEIARRLHIYGEPVEFSMRYFNHKTEAVK